MGWLDPVVNKVKKTITPPKRPTISYAADPTPPKNRSEFQQRESFIQQVRSDPDLKNEPIEGIYAAWNGGRGLPQAPAQSPFIPRQQQTGGGTASRGGGGRRGGGGGGGGGGAAAQAQSALDFLLPMLAGKNYQAQPLTGVRQAIAEREGGIGTATQQDLASATGAYDYLDQWLGSNLNDPYANVRLGQARVAPNQNAYLASQGAAPLNDVQANPEDAYGGFQNMLALLGGNARQMKQSSQAGSQMARASSTTGINAMDNAYRDAIRQQLAAVANQEATNQQTLDAERRQALMQILPLLQAGAKAPADALANLGLA